MFIRQASNGSWYVSRIVRAGHRGRAKRSAIIRNWFLIKDNGGSGYLNIGGLYFPKEFLGKRILLKVEFME